VKALLAHLALFSRTLSTASKSRRRRTKTIWFSRKGTQQRLDQSPTLPTERAPPDKMSNPSQDAVSAVERVFQIPELVFAITENLKRERIDLVTLSLVSRFWRSMARKALLRDLDIPLTNWFKIDNFIIRNPKLVADIRHIRLWDDNLHATSRWRGAWRPTAALVRLPPPPPQQRAHPLDSVPSSKWYGLEGALGSLFPKDSKEHPTLDVSIGIANIGSFKVLLARTPRALSAIVSLRIVIDHPKTSSTDLSCPIRGPTSQALHSGMPSGVSFETSMMLSVVARRPRNSNSFTSRTPQKRALDGIHSKNSTGPVWQPSCIPQSRVCASTCLSGTQPERQVCWTPPWAAHSRSLGRISVPSP